MKYQAPLAALALSVCAWPIHAATPPHAEAWSKITNLSIRVVDLVPSDGVEASFSLIDSSLTTAWVPDVGESLPGLLTPLTLEQTRPGVVAFGSIGPNAIGVSLIADGEHDHLPAYISSGYSYTPRYAGNILLSPGSALVISGTFDMALKLECPVFCTAETSAQVTLYPRDQSQGWAHTLNSLVDGTDASYSNPFTVSYSNYHSFSENLQLRFYAEARMSTVPEPVHLALLLAGLATATTMRRKRRWLSRTALD